MLFTKKSIKKETKEKRKYTKRKDNLKVNSKNKMTPEQERVDNVKNFRKVLAKMQKMDNINGYIILVDNSFGEKKQKDFTCDGISCVLGKTGVLTNLFINIPTEVMKNVKQYMMATTIMDEIKKMSEEFLKDSKTESKK